jgi:2-succinyl-6-hydroxy-2,4-cyclohexadiene-1-carboxylate synthase
MRIPWEVHPGDGPHLLLVHGFLTGPAQWQANLQALAAGCTPVTVSLWGHAGAPSPRYGASYHPDHYVGQFERIRQQLGVDRWYVLGYSLGASLTLRYALQHPQRIAGHVFTNSTSALADDEQIRTWRRGSAESAARIRTGGIRAMERIAVHPRHARRLPAPIYQALMSDAARHDPAGIANTFLHTTPAASVRRRIAANRCPALLICGARERRFRPLRDYADAHMPCLQVVDLPAGHGMNMELPEAFNAAVLDFLHRCQGG